jgi:hypothetical protein
MFNDGMFAKTHKQNGKVGIIEMRRSEFTAPIFCIGKPGKDGKIPLKFLPISYRFKGNK